MTPDAIKQAAAMLSTARRTRQMLERLPETCRPATPTEGYAVQKSIIATWGEPIAGWKSGATAIPVQQRFGLTEPFLGPFFAPSVLKSPASVEASAYEHRKLAAGSKPGVALEVEFAYRVGTDIPAGQAMSEAQVLDSIDAVVPAFEIIQPRFQAIPFGSPGEALADCGMNGGMVLGEPMTEWRQIDYPNHATKLVVDGKTVAEGNGSLVLGHPFKSLVWLVNAVRGMGFAMPKGQVLTTGSMTGIVYVDAGSVAVGDFGTLGRVQLTIR